MVEYLNGGLAMKIIDISMSVCFDMPVYKGKASKRPQISTDSASAPGAAYESRLEMNLHTGTHIDTPRHIFDNGSTVDTLDLGKVVTKCRVLDFKDADSQISKEHLEQKKISEGDFILIKTKNSYLDILEGDFIFLDKSGAEYLKSKGVIGVGIDALGIERSQPEHETHKILLGCDIVILEGLRLKDVEEDDYLLVAAPVKIAGTEAAPVRALLIK